MAILEEQQVENKQEEMKGAQSLRKGKVVGMGLPKTFPPQMPQNLLYFQQNLSF